MDRRALIALGILAGAAFGYYLFRQRKGSGSGTPPEPTDQGPAQAAQANYTVPPNIGAQMNQPNQVFTTNTQTMPYPYNT